MAHANQYASPRRTLLWQLDFARQALRDGSLWLAQDLLKMFRARYATIPASTRRRWKCGR